jgi:glycosyltransferase involved in cell wall biosynthesis
MDSGSSVTRAGLPSTIFVGKQGTGICWYRCAVPAMALGVEWVGVAGVPPDARFVTGLTRRPLQLEDLFAYDVVILQQPIGNGWKDLLRRLQAAGTTVLFEIDDYIHSVRKMDTHELKGSFTKEMLRSAELNMRLADGIICSTPYLARRYGGLNKHVWICRNGLDLARYELEPAPRSGVTIGWAGGVGHEAALRRWLPAVAEVLRQRPEARFVTVGRPYASILAEEFGPERCQSVPFAPLEMYPAAMSRFDIAIAPSAQTNLFRGKSDLRWLESSALGTPVVGDPTTYAEIEDGVTGFHASSVQEVTETLIRLVDDPALRRRVGDAARDHVRSKRSARVTAQDWAHVLRDVAGRRAAAAA